LAVLDRRQDGFHNLESLFVALNFGDTLKFELLNEENLFEIMMAGTGTEYSSVPVQSNLIYKAMSLFRNKTGFSGGIKVNVEKRIPLGSGLGGGSSNAAFTLLALNKLAGFPLSRQELLEMGAHLGSDVPFFIHETGAAWVTGCGEIVEPVEVPDLFLYL